jgi:hypothetical protein
MTDPLWVISNKYLRGKITKTKTSKTYFNFISKKRNTAFEISNAKMDQKTNKQGSRRASNFENQS